jgi:hypothetical protein
VRARPHVRDPAVSATYTMDSKDVFWDRESSQQWIEMILKYLLAKLKTYTDIQAGSASGVSQFFATAGSIYLRYSYNVNHLEATLTAHTVTHCPEQ